MSKTPSLTDLTCAGILATGGQEVPSRSGKYRCFKFTDSGGVVETIWVGRSGGFRKGRTVADSISMQGGPLHKRVLEAGRQFFNANNGVTK